MFLFASAVALGSNVRVAQIESFGNGTNNYQPDYSQYKGITFTQGTAATGGTSSHATTVTSYLVGGPVKPSSIIIWYSGDFVSRGGLNGGRTLEPAPAAWELENHSWGGTSKTYDNNQYTSTQLKDAKGNLVFVNGVVQTTPVTIPGALEQEAKRLARDNVMAFIAVADDNTPPPTPLMNHVVSPYAIKVGTTTTGMRLDAQSQPDVYEAIDYTSYACPKAATVGMEEIAWAQDHGIKYDAKDLARILITSCVKDDKGRPMVSETATMANEATFYGVMSVPTPVPSPTSVPTPIPTPTAIPTPSPVPTATPTPTPTRDQLCAKAAASVGCTYVNGQFVGVTPANLAALLAALKASGAL